MHACMHACVRAWAPRRAPRPLTSPALPCPALPALPNRPLPGWLEDRIDSVYQQHPGYSPKANTLFTMDQRAPEDLPDALRGEKWAFVQLPLATLQQVRAGGRAGRGGAGRGGRWQHGKGRRGAA